MTQRASELIAFEKFKATKARKRFLRDQKPISHYSQKLEAERE